MTSKQRAFLKSLAMKLDPVFNIGKESLTDSFLAAVEESLEANELIKIGVLKNCGDDPRELACAVAEGTDAEVVQIIGKKIVLYRQAREPEKRKIVLPKAKNRE